MESTVGQVALHARCIEAAVHQPDGWVLRVDGIEVPVEVRTAESKSRVKVTFVAGPIPAGSTVVSLELNGVPMHVREATFDPQRCFWALQMSARLSGR